jgi:plastocyanin
MSSPALGAGPYRVTISVNPQGNFTYDPSHLRVKKNDQVTFVSVSGSPFEVAFKDQSPGDKVFLSPGNDTLTISPNAANGIYHYATAIYDARQARVFLDSGCGDIGVEN